MTEDERATIVLGIELIAKHGRAAVEAIVAAVQSGTLEEGVLEEAEAQLGDAVAMHLPEDHRD